MVIKLAILCIFFLFDGYKVDGNESYCYERPILNHLDRQSTFTLVGLSDVQYISRNIISIHGLKC